MSTSLAPAPSTVCPYVGLRYFREADAQFFYGRDEHVADLLTKFALNRFVAVLGASASGKSSLVRAGLLRGTSLWYDPPRGTQLESDRI